MISPIYDRLCAYKEKNKISFAMPSHKGSKGLECDFCSLDVTELPDTVDLMHPDEATQKSFSLLAKAYKADKSLILTCGSTIAVHAMICSAIKSGDTLLAASDCHMSVVNICSLMGINIIFIPKEYDESSQIPTKTKSIRKILENNADIKACIVTSPNYFGVCSDIASLAKECHAFNIPLLVDEAHGAHFIASDRLPKTAMELGADISCQSAHKTLNALTGGAYLHIKSDLVEYESLYRAVCMLHTSSPSYPIAASAERAFCNIKSQDWDTWCDLCEKVKDDIESKTLVHFLKNDDPTRIVAIFDKYDVTGFDIAKELSDKYNIDIEMSTPTAIVLITSPWNTKKDLECFVCAIVKICMTLQQRQDKMNVFYPPCPEVVVTPRFSKKSTRTHLADSVSKVCADTVTVYPPGIPVLYPGSVITKEALGYITDAKKHGALISGIKEDYINIIEE